MDWITAPWPWYVAGPAITLVMYLMYYLGARFGVSSTLDTICSASGGERFADHFRFDWKTGIWNLVFVFGGLLGGFIASQWMTGEVSIELSESTKTSLISYGITDPGADYLPGEIFNLENLITPRGLIFVVLGGFLVGFGTRYANGCTSGHAITGLSNLELSSLIAVVGFFIGGLFVTHLLIPVLL